MQTKKKQCINCLTDQYIWSNRFGRLCKTCYYQLYPPDIKIKPIPIKKSFKPIKGVSNKKIEELKLYRVERDKYLKEHSICEFPGCTSLLVELHHKAGRIGNLLIDSSNFCSLCNYHHHLIEMQPLLAKELDLSRSRLNK